MEPCIGKWLLIGTCLLITLTGLWLAVLREMRNIKAGKKDIQKLLYDKQNGTFNFSLAIGVLLIGGGLYAAIYTEQHNIGCNNKTTTQKPEDKEATLLFKLSFNPELDHLRFLERSPRFNDRNIAKQESGYFEEEVTIPDGTNNYFALVAPRLTSNTLGNDVVQTPLEICFRRTNKAIGENQILAVFYADENMVFRQASSDPGCVILCNEEQSNNNLFGLFKSAYAQTSNSNSALYGWAVPNLQTLRNEKKSGFSEINLRSKTLPIELKNANCFYYAVTINETSIFFDGLLPKHQVLAFSYADGLNLSFGIENLGFSGNSDGYENIDITLEFLNDSEHLLSIPLSLNYVALRKNDKEKIESPDGSIFEWEAKFTANNENQIFIGSVQSASDAVFTQKRLNRKNLTFNENKLIGVIRPPYLQNTNYGICVGMLLPNSQIKFTFTDAEAAQLKYFLQSNNYNNPLVRALRDN